LDNLHQLPTSPVDLSQYKVDFVVKFSAISEVGLEKAWKQYLDKVSSLPTFHASINSFPHLQSNSFKNDRVRLSSDNSSPLRSVVGIEHGLERVYQLGDKQIVFPIDITVASAPTAESVSIIGNAEVGQTLRGSYTFDDANGDKEGVSTFQWYRGNTKISGATQKAYTLTSAELGEAIKFEVTPVSATGTPTTLTGVAVQSSATTPVVATSITSLAAPAAPTVTNVLISGNAEVGQTLRGSYTFDDANGDKEGVSTFQWYRGNTKISGATQKAYTLTSTELGEAIKFEVTPVSATGTPTTLTGVAVQSSTTTPVVAAPAAPTVTNVLISGNAEVGQTLRGSYTFDDANGDKEGASTFQWYRGNTKISGATQKSYTLTSAELGEAIKFEVTPVSATGTPTTLTGAAVQSNATAPVVARSAAGSVLKSIGLKFDSRFSVVQTGNTSPMGHVEAVFDDSSTNDVSSLSNIKVLSCSSCATIRKVSSGFVIDFLQKGTIKIQALYQGKTVTSADIRIIDPITELTRATIERLGNQGYGFIDFGEKDLKVSTHMYHRVISVYVHKSTVKEYAFPGHIPSPTNQATQYTVFLIHKTSGVSTTAKSELLVPIGTFVAPPSHRPINSWNASYPNLLYPNSASVTLANELNQIW
jgi:hypothetical protein